MALLEIQKLKKSYSSPEGETQPVLDVATFTMELGEQIALEGESGSGKTTFLNCIAGLLTPDSGRIVVSGVDVPSLSEARRDAFRSRHIGFIHQTFHLLDGYSALENVLLGMMFGPGPDPALARSLLGELGLADRMNHRPNQLSIGQQQRVAVARALGNRPHLVLADEPTGNLDATRAGEALELTKRLCRDHGAALLLVSHDRNVLDDFDKCVRLDEISRVGDEAPAALPADDPTDGSES